MSIILSNFKTHRLSDTRDQAALEKYISWVMAVGECQDKSAESADAAQAIYQKCTDRMTRFGVSPDLINNRQFSVFDECGDLSECIQSKKLPLFNSERQSTSKGAPLEDRMEYFSRVVSDVFDKFYSDIDDQPDDLIHVTCSGYLSPSPAQRLVSKKSWYDTNVTHSYHMGCYGAFPPVNIALGYLAANTFLPKQKKRIDIVHSELLSIHADFSALTPSDIVIMTLFADGFAKYSAYTEEEFERINANGISVGNKQDGFKVLASHNTIIPNSLEEMTWTPKSNVFEMYLSKNVPLLIKDTIHMFVSDLCALIGINFEKEKSNLLFAIHPGGPKIVNHIQECLGLADEQLNWSKEVLKKHGNMSSATVPHIWKKMLEDRDIRKGTKIVSMAFGPGLTATGFVFEKV